MFFRGVEATDRKELEEEGGKESSRRGIPRVFEPWQRLDRFEPVPLSSTWSKGLGEEEEEYRRDIERGSGGFRWFLFY